MTRPDISPEQLRIHQQRWQAVAAVAAEERKAETIAVRWQRLNAIIRLAAGLQLPLDQEDDTQTAVWRRWQKLKELFDGHTQI